MASCPTVTYLVRKYRGRDRQAVRDICVATAWLGAPLQDDTADGWIWAEFWTRYFTDREPGCAWVVERCPDGSVVGYLTGTPDEGRARRYVPFLLPGIIGHVVRRRLLWTTASRRAILAMLGSIAGGELDLPPRAGRDFPATFHFNLLPEARGKGIGAQLFRGYIGEMRRMRVRGVHAQTLSTNEAVTRFLIRHGFRRIASHPLHAFAHVRREPIDLHTWVLPL